MIMARRVFGTRKAMITWMTRKPVIVAIAKKCTYRVVRREIVVREPAGERRPEISNHLAWPYRKKHPSKTASSNAEHDIDEAVDGKEPHGGEMPKERAGEPATERDRGRKHEPEQRRGVVDLPAGADHHQNGEHIDPVGDANPERMNRR